MLRGTSAVRIEGEDALNASFPDFLAAVRDAKPTLAFVLGSGMSGVPDRFVETASIPFADVPELAGSTVVGHSARIAVGTLNGCPLLLFRGRLHFYEGHPWERVGRPIRYAAEWGVSTVILTNAAGGIRDDLNPGNLMAIEDHIAWLAPNAWSLERAPSPYSHVLIERLRGIDPAMRAGVYAGLTGPTYETHAEIRALRAIGADAVGMSTVYEAETAAGLGMDVAGISLITNKAAGLGAAALDHTEVLDVAKRQEEHLSQVLFRFCER